MIQAELKGKIPDVQNKEDILTSNVFGMLKYISHEDVLPRILCQAKTLSGKSFLECVDSNLAKYTPEFIFWEQIGSYGEPDLIIKFKKEGEPDLILCIEVKYWSSKSGEGDDDQLKRYFEGMTEFASLTKSTFLGVIYLTKLPSRMEITESLNYIEEKGIINAEDKLFQLRWFEITETIMSLDLSLLTKAEKAIVEDLQYYLQYKSLIRFSKFTFQSETFEKSPDTFYIRFKGFTFLIEDFNIKIDNFYKSD